LRGGVGNAPRWRTGTTMSVVIPLTKRIVSFALGFAALGIMTGACVPFFVHWRRTAANLGLPESFDNMHPLLLLLHVAIPIGLFLGLYLGALTGLGTAFSSGRFATVRCLLAITVSFFVAAVLYGVSAEPRMKGDPPTPRWHGAVLLLVPVTMAVLLAFSGYRRSRAKGNSSKEQGPKTERRIEQVSETANNSYSQRPPPADQLYG
jgi:hypothetical protein